MCGALTRTLHLLWVTCAHMFRILQNALHHRHENLPRCGDATLSLSELDAQSVVVHFVDDPLTYILREIEISQRPPEQVAHALAEPVEVPVLMTNQLGRDLREVERLSSFVCKDLLELPEVSVVLPKERLTLTREVPNPQQREQWAPP